MRGTQLCWFAHAPIAGIIPAYAGNTRSCSSAPTRARDHPRVCGEHDSEGYQRSRRQGSSPRMRGTRHRLLSRWWNVGIIPAYAGNTQSTITASERWRDHPRVCGEHRSHSLPKVFAMGSSPRMRGTLMIGRRFIDCAGIIPAYAGNTVHSACGMPPSWDHPRVCGEHQRRTDETIRYRGSSPRMRGTLRWLRHEYGVYGIIPAYAGNTRHTLPRAARRGDHPRVCGEHTKRLA